MRARPRAETKLKTLSIDTRPPQSTATPTASAEEPAKPKLDLSVTQVLGGALAAMTAAYLGSRLSVAGTVVGAALASIVAAVAGSVYTASLRSTRSRVRTVWQGRVAGSALPASVELVEDEAGADPTGPLTQPHLPATAAAAVPPLRGRRLSWKSVAAVALAAFALAGVTLTGVELATGGALSGGDGTTLNQVTEQVTEPRRADPKPTASTSPEPVEPASSATESSSAEPSEAPCPVVTSAPPQPSAEPTESAPTPAPAPSTTLPVEPTATSEATPDTAG